MHYDLKKILHESIPEGTTILLLHEAVEGDQPDMVQLLLLHGFNPNVKAKGGFTPLHLAVTKCSVGCVRALIENGADINIKDEQGQDAITIAELQEKTYETEAVLEYLHIKGMELWSNNKMTRCLISLISRYCNAS